MPDFIIEGLYRLSQKPNSRIVFSGAQAWFVIQNYDNAHRALIEAPTALAALDDAPIVALSSDKTSMLTRAGYKKRRNGRSWGRIVQLDTDEARKAIAHEIIALFLQVYDIDLPEIGLDFQESIKSGVINRSLEVAIRQLSLKRDQQSRFSLYRELIRAQLVLPLVRQGSEKPRVFGQLMSFSTYAVFTSDKALRTYEPRGFPFRVITGRRLFPLLKSRQAGSLLINPNGDVGGELYKHEIESICDAMNRYG